MALPAADHDGLALPAGLTAPQREAVAATDRSLCVLAGAGAGKTRVLTLRVARRVHDGSADPGHVLVCTFSRKAADELRRRLWMLGVSDGIRAGTFHRTALGLLRQQRADRGAPPPVVLADRRAVLAAVLEEERPEGAPAWGGRRRSPVGQLETEIGWAKARLVTPEAYAAEAQAAGRTSGLGPERVAELYRRYEDERRRRGALDLDDLLWSCADMLEQDAAFGDAVRWRYRHLFVDEMQDVNPAQFRLLRALFGPDPDLFVVGDPNQSVYGWNGADPGLLDHLPVTVPGTRVLRLDENHRSSPQVVAVAASALGLPGTHAPTSARPDGPMPSVAVHGTDAEEATWVARQAWLAHRPGRRWSQIAVLARTNAQLTKVAEALEKARIPWRAAGGDLAPASDVREALEPATPAVDQPAMVGLAAEHTAEDGDGVVLATFHRAKGLQWPAVFVIGLSEGLVPLGSATSEAALDEERRLLYVALTRAEDELACTWALYRDARLAGSGGAPRRASRWLEAIERARAELVAGATPTEPAAAAARWRQLRAQLDATAEPRPDDGRPDHRR